VSVNEGAVATEKATGKVGVENGYEGSTRAEQLPIKTEKKSTHGQVIWGN